MRRLAPLAGILLLVVALVAALAFSLRDLWRTPADNRVASDKKQEEAAPPVPAKPASNDPGAGAAAKTAPGSDSNKPVIKPEPPKPPQQVASDTTPKPAPSVSPTPIVATPPKPVPEAPPRPAVPGERREIGKYLVENKAPPSLLLRRQTDKPTWQRVRAPVAAVYTTDYLVSLPGYRSTVQLNSGVRLLLWGNLPDGRRVSVLESAVQLNDNPEVDLDLNLDRGRIALANAKDDGPARIKLHFQRETWEVTLLKKGSEVVVELWGLNLPGVGFKDPKNDSPLAGLGLFATSGEAELKVGYFRYNMHEPKGPAAYYWDNLGPAEAGPRTLEVLPPWLKQPTLPAQLPALEALNARLNKSPVDVALPEALKEPDPYVRGLGVFSLGAVDNLPVLLDALADESHPDVRQNAVSTLRHWIALAAGNAQKLYARLEHKYKAGPAEIIMELLYPYSKEQLENPATWEGLIAYLDHPKLPIRELANGHLAALLPEIYQKIPYDPAGGSDQRPSAVAAWKKIIPDGQLPPKAGTPTPPKEKDKPK